MMTLDLVPGWSVQLERGPDCLFARLRVDGEPCGEVRGELAEKMIQLLKQELARRLVLELDEVPALPSDLLDELVSLDTRVSEGGGIMRICGLSDSHHAVLRDRHLSDRFACYRNREEALMGSTRPMQPR